MRGGASLDKKQLSLVMRMRRRASRVQVHGQLINYAIVCRSIDSAAPVRTAQNAPAVLRRLAQDAPPPTRSQINWPLSVNFHEPDCSSPCNFSNPAICSQTVLLKIV